MAELTPAGIQATDLTVYVTRIERALQEALGNDLNLAPETPQGQIAGCLGIVLTELDELATYIAAGLNLNQASGLQLSDYGALVGLPIIRGEKSSVLVTLSGVPNTSIPSGSRVRTTTGAVFASEAAALIPSSGAVEAKFLASAIGPVLATAGELKMIVDVITGWTGATNKAAAALGRDRESDAEYRRRYRGEVASHGRDGLEMIRARVLQQTGVTGALVRDNSTAADVTTQAITIAAGSILVIAEGGANADIAAGIAATRPVGVPTAGNISVNVPHAQGHTVEISFRRVALIPIKITVTTVSGEGFPADGLAQMRANLLAWIRGTWVPGPGIFYQGGTGIGERLDLNRLLSPLNAVPGHMITSVTAKRVAGSAAIGSPNLDQRYTLESTNVIFVLS